MEVRNCSTHPDRAAVGHCVVCGAAVCERCIDNAGGQRLCGRHAAVMLIEGWAQVYGTSDDVSAQLIRDNLRLEGFDAEVFSQKDHFAFTADMGDLSPVRVMVPAEQFDDALQIVRAYMDGRGEVGFACPACGELLEPGAERCPSCGTVLS